MTSARLLLQLLQTCNSYCLYSTIPRTDLHEGRIVRGREKHVRPGANSLSFDAKLDVLGVYSVQVDMTWNEMTEDIHATIHRKADCVKLNVNFQCRPPDVPKRSPRPASDRLSTDEC